MNRQPVLTLAATAFLCSLFAAPSIAHDPGRREGTIMGELVVMDAAHNRFRVVGHPGSFTAPSGVSLRNFDGKPVHVEFSDGRVAQIVEAPVEVRPIAHHFEVVTGEVVVRDAVGGTFMIAGDNRVYRAPAGTDLRRYEGRRADVSLNERGEVIGLSLAGAPAAMPEAQREASGDTCEFGGMNYAAGTTQCERGTRFRCEQGMWRNLGTTCAAGDAPERPGRICKIGDATVLHGSSICRHGLTVRCVDGAWVESNRPCS